MMVDSVYGIEQLTAAKIDGKPWSVYLKIDTGDKRGFCQTICVVLVNLSIIQKSNYFLSHGLNFVLPYYIHNIFKKNIQLIACRYF